MTEGRKPGSFRVEAETPREPERASQPRTPRSVRAKDLAVVTPAEIDVFDSDGLDPLAPPRPVGPPRRSGLARIFIGAAGLFVSLGIGLWAESVIRALFARTEWLGWTAAAIAAVAVVALLAIIVREVYALMRLASVEALRKRAADAELRNDSKEARAAVADLVVLVGRKPETAAGRRAVVDLKGEVMDGTDFLRFAEAEILAPLDEKAKTLILDAAKRVSVVTAVSPRALVDLAYVAFEAARLIRRLCELYGGRPGTLGFFKLARDVLAHLAVTGSLAAGDTLVQQLVGQGLAARLSTKLGEGVVNGMMTVRIGIAAMETSRPLPFSAVRRPGVRDFLSALTSFATKGRGGADAQAE